MFSDSRCASGASAWMPRSVAAVRLTSSRVRLGMRRDRGEGGVGDRRVRDPEPQDVRRERRQAASRHRRPAARGLRGGPGGTASHRRSAGRRRPGPRSAASRAGVGRVSDARGSSGRRGTAARGAFRRPAALPAGARARRAADRTRRPVDPPAQQPGVGRRQRPLAPRRHHVRVIGRQPDAAHQLARQRTSGDDDRPVVAALQDRLGRIEHESAAGGAGPWHVTQCAAARAGPASA